jgi:hypothetical protein
MAADAVDNAGTTIPLLLGTFRVRDRLTEDDNVFRT